MSDILTMVWKETKDSLLQGGWSAVIRPLLLIGILGIGFPWRFGLQWLALKAVPAQAISSLSTSQIWLIAMAVLAVLDAILLGVSLVSFQRSRLILS